MKGSESEHKRSSVVQCILGFYVVRIKNRIFSVLKCFTAARSENGRLIYMQQNVKQRRSDYGAKKNGFKHL